MSQANRSGPPRTAILHYTAPPVVGGVEVVIRAHVRTFVQFGYPVTVIAGRGEADAAAPQAALIHLPLLDSQHPQVLEASSRLEVGEVPQTFADLVDLLIAELAPLLSRFDTVIVHNVFTKHFNLPLTAALFTLLQAGTLGNCIAWCHDFSWTSANSRAKLHPGYPWDLLRTYRPDVTYVTVSQRRQQELAALFNCPPEQIHVVYNGVDPHALLGLSAESNALASRLNLSESDLIMLMPVRVTRAKNIEYALHVVAALKARGYRPKLVLTGPPDPHDAQSVAYFRELQALRWQLGVEDEMRFVYESGPDADQPFIIDERMAGDLFRMSDVMFMPSHREGFGMPVLEAGLARLLVVSTASVPAAVEIGGGDVMLFDPEQDPGDVAGELLARIEVSPTHRLRRRVRQDYTWQAIFERDIRPWLTGKGRAADRGEQDADERR